jgi:hypothetical protein
LHKILNAANTGKVRKWLFYWTKGLKGQTISDCFSIFSGCNQSQIFPRSGCKNTLFLIKNIFRSFEKRVANQNRKTI